ncbi:MAG: hypothetical protein AAFO17_15105 [Pseudomonadota bacterium]
MRRRTLLYGLLTSPFVIAGGSLAWLLRRVPDEPLSSDPDMTDFAYSDGWIIQVRR